MRLSACLIAVLLLLTCSTQAQQRTRYGTVKGIVLDSANRQPVEAATISVFLIADSSLINFVLTNRKGEFQVKDVPISKPCQLLVSYNGLKSHTEQFTIPDDKTEAVLTPIRLGKSVKELEEVMVIGQRPPMLMKKDTMEFNAGSFKTMPNAVLEDLVKQLPGIDVDKDGNLTMNGRKINKITIDGKDFFGNDPQVALKNLPRNIIDKIQVVDNKTREAQFNKTTTGNEDKVLNLTLKKDQNQGWFGRASGGYGSEERYEASANMNMFNSKKQISIVTNANNTNRGTYGGGSFSINNAQSSLGGGSTGFTDNKSAGLNFSNVFSNKLTFSGSYFFNRSAYENNTLTKRQYILPDSTFYYNSVNSNINSNNNHRLNVSMEYRPDTMTSMYINASYGKSDGQSGSVNDANSLNDKGKQVNTSFNELNGKTDGNNIATDFFVGRRFRKEGRSLSMTLNYSLDKSNSTDFNKGRVWVLKNDGSDSVDLIDQKSRSGSKNNSYGFSIGYTEPIVKDLNMLFRYSYRVGTGNSDKNTSIFNPATNEYDRPDPKYTDAFTSRSETSNPDISLNYFKTNKYRLTAGFGMQWLTQKSTSVIQKDMDQKYVNIFPSASFTYQLNRTGELSIFYNGSSLQPSAQQLQPVPDNSNPLYIIMGNPDLRPSFNHNINVTIRQSKGQLFWYGGLSFTTTTNQIVNESYFDDLGRQVNKPLNLNGNFGFNGNGTVSKTYKARDFVFRLNANSSISYNKNVSRIDKINVESKNYSLNGRLYLSATYKELINLMPSYGIRFNDARYNVTQNQDASSVTHTIATDIFINWPKSLILENSIQYNYNSRIAPGFKKGVTTWNAAANYQLFKSKRGMLRLAIYDILKQNTNVTRNITQNYVQDVQVQVLQQYFMASFMYTLQNFGGRK